jgi:hypothetical protein
MHRKMEKNYKRKFVYLQKFKQESLFENCSSLFSDNFYFEK